MKQVAGRAAGLSPRSWFSLLRSDSELRWTAKISRRLWCPDLHPSPLRSQTRGTSLQQLSSL